MNRAIFEELTDEEFNELNELLNKVKVGKFEYGRLLALLTKAAGSIKEARADE